MVWWVPDYAKSDIMGGSSKAVAEELSTVVEVSTKQEPRFAGTVRGDAEPLVSPLRLDT